MNHDFWLIFGCGFSLLAVVSGCIYRAGRAAAAKRQKEIEDWRRRLYSGGRSRL